MCATQWMQNKVVHLCSLSCFRSDVLCFYSSAQDMSPFFLSSNNSLKSVPVFQLSNTLISGTKTGGSKKKAHSNIVNVIIMGNRWTASHNEKIVWLRLPRDNNAKMRSFKSFPWKCSPPKCRRFGDSHFCSLYHPHTKWSFPVHNSNAKRAFGMNLERVDGIVNFS